MGLQINQIYQGDCITLMKEIQDNFVDAIITDPPYELGFMGKSWDCTGIANNVKVWQQALRVLKPGGYLLSFGGSRTYHRMACAIEDAGFEIRDMIEWIYGSGFPKSLNIGKAIEGYLEIGSSNQKDIRKLKGETVESNNAWDKLNFEQNKRDKIYTQYKTNVDYQNEISLKYQGWGTALKPAHEPICMARKPLSEKTVAENVLKYGTGGINIDECRAEYGNETDSRIGTDAKAGGSKESIFGEYSNVKDKDIQMYKNNGRFPANLIHDGSEEVLEIFPDSKGQQGDIRGTEPSHTGQNGIYGDFVRVPAIPKRNDSGSAARFFYCAKASKSERDMGLDNEPNKIGGGMQGTADQTLLTGSGNIRNNVMKNNHPTVKPLALMEYLIKLVTINNALVLDPFAGSGSTLLACKNLKRNYIGIELSPEYCTIAYNRLKSLA